MNRLESIEREIQQLSAKDLAAFRQWYATFDAELWDRQLEDDVKAGKLDALAEQALSAHKKRQSTQL